MGSISEAKISKAQRRYKVGYVNVQHVTRTTKMTLYYKHIPSLHLKDNWLEETGVGTDTPVMVTADPPGC
jgi:toxic protein SymE